MEEHEKSTRGRKAGFARKNRQDSIKLGLADQQ